MAVSLALAVKADVVTNKPFGGLVPIEIAEEIADCAGADAVA
jgi:hypothetical protein